MTPSGSLTQTTLIAHFGEPLEVSNNYKAIYTYQGRLKPDTLEVVSAVVLRVLAGNGMGVRGGEEEGGGVRVPSTPREVLQMGLVKALLGKLDGGKRGDGGSCSSARLHEVLRGGGCQAGRVHAHGWLPHSPVDPPLPRHW